MKRKLSLLVVLSLCALAGQARTALGQSSDPTLPILFDTIYPNQTGGDIHQPASASELQTLLNTQTLNGKTLKLGDTIVLQANVTYSGKFTFPKVDTGSGWIIVRTSNESGIPRPDHRINPSYAAAMPKLEISTNDAVVKFASGAHHYWLAGLEIRYPNTDPNAKNDSLVRIGSSETVSANLPSNIVIDRCYIHGNSNGELQRGVALNGTYSAVINSYISDVHLRNSESQAIISQNTSGPLKVFNNYLEAAGENLFFGGVSAISQSPSGPSNVEVRGNYLYKPTAWRDNLTNPNLPHWNVKNLLEFKSGQKVLVAGNVLENNWINSDQHGFAVVIKSTAESPNNVTQDVTFINNIVRHTLNGVGVTGRADSTLETNRIKIANNLFEDVSNANRGDQTSTYEAGIFLQISGGDSITLDHNSAFHTGKVVYTFNSTGNTSTTGFVYKNNLTSNDNAAGVDGDGTAQGSETLGYYMPGYVFLKNVIPRVDPTIYPASNYYPATLDGTTYVGTDGQNVGVNQATLDAATAGAISGVWPDSGSQDVTWTSPVGVTVSGNSLTKTGTTAWNAGAISAQTLSGGDGYVEFSTNEANKSKLIGLSYQTGTSLNEGQSYQEIEYALHLRNDGNVLVFESGINLGVKETYAAGNKFRVAIEGGVVKYQKSTDGANFMTFWTNSSPTLQYPMAVDTSLYNTGATLTDARLFATTAMVWTQAVGVTVSGDMLTKTGATGWNAGAISTQTLTGSGYVEFSTNEADKSKLIGLSYQTGTTLNEGQSYQEIEYALHLRNDGNVLVFESGMNLGVKETYVAGNKFRVTIEGGMVKYQKSTDGVNFTTFYTNSAPTLQYPMVVDTSLYNTGATVKDVVLSGAWN